MIPAILAAGGTVSVLASRDRERARELAERYAIARVVGSYKAALGRDVDAVYIPLPNSLHKPWTLLALKAGKHVLCEKPLALTGDEAAEMGAAAVRAGLVLAEAVMYRYHPRWAQIRGLLERGRIGRLRHIQGTFMFQLREPPEVRWERELGGGALLDIGSYLINVSRWLAGSDPSAVVARLVERRGVDETAEFTLDFSAGDHPVGAQLLCSFAAAEHQSLELIGTDAALTIPKPFTAWRGEAVPVLLEPGSGEPAKSIPTSSADPYQEMAAAFTAAVRKGTPVLTGARQAEGTLKVIEACRRSHQSGAWERLA